MQALSGLASISGRAGQPPTPVGTAVVDQHGAALLALGVLAALHERARTGRGLHVEISMLRAALDLQVEIATYFLDGAPLEKSATPLASTFHPPPYGVYETKDGYLALSMSPLSDLAAALDLPALARYAEATWVFEEREEVAQLIEPALKRRATADWLEILIPKGIWAAPVLTHAQTFADPAVQASDATEEITHPVAGPVRLLRFPIGFSTGRAGVRRPPPMPGEHADEILGELGPSDSEISRLRTDGVV